MARWAEIEETEVHAEAAGGPTVAEVLEVAHAAGLTLDRARAEALRPLLQGLLAAAAALPMGAAAEAGWLGDPYDAARGPHR
ncbi:MAG TPA: hypothetical protein VNN74_00120 [Candidatus Micrarchaeia archaeon]|nr:hypothetical protein [Candidatus Micrarchaeia archaeon]